MKNSFPWTLAFLGAILIGQARATDDDDKKKSEKRVVVTVQDDHDDADSDDKNKSEVDEKRVIVLRGTRPDVEKIVAELKEQLENSKLDSKTRKKILDQVRKAIDSKQAGNVQVMEVEVDSHGKAEGNAKMKVEAKGKVMVVDESGKVQEFELKSGEPLKWTAEPGGKVVVGDIDKNLHEDLLNMLKQHGVEQSVIDKMTATLHDHLQNHGGAIAIASGPQFRLGIALESNDDGKLVVGSVVDESPAAKAGLKEGDVLVAINDEKIDDAASLIAAVQEAGKNGNSVELEIMRGDDTKEMKLKPEESNVAIQSMPSDLKVMIDKLPQGIQGGFFVPGQPANRLELSRISSPSKEMTELKEQVESLKSELSEIKAMLKEMKDKK